MLRHCVGQAGIVGSTVYFLRDLRFLGFRVCMHIGTVRTVGHI